MEISMSFVLEKSSFASVDGVSCAGYYIWVPDFAPVGVVQISHGMKEHIGRYRAFAEFLARRGYAVCGNDHIGHGLTSPSDDDLGYIPRRGGGDMIVEDMHTMTRIVKERFPGLPLFLLGHSMGSFAARLYMSKYGREMAGVLLSGTGGPGQPTGIGKKLSLAAGLTNKGRRRSKLIDRIAFGSYLKHIERGSPRYSWLSRDAVVVEEYTNDKYCSSRIFTADGFYTLFDMLGRVSAKGWAARVPASLPVLIASGKSDPVGNYGSGPRAVYNRLLSAGLNDVTLSLYPEMRHEILNEIGREQVWEDFYEWIEKRTPGRGEASAETV